MRCGFVACQPRVSRDARGALCARKEEECSSYTGDSVLLTRACRRCFLYSISFVAARDGATDLANVCTLELQLKSVGCQFVVIGHSERRHGNCASETDAIFNHKVLLPSHPACGLARES
jgi:hypothetical protein